MQKKIENIIIQTLIELNEELENETLNNPTKDTRLFGTNSGLDSLALVSLITEIEEKISDELDKDIILADEKAMSQKTSPFRSIESLSNYILISE
jgi:acyl carrier protein